MKFYLFTVSCLIISALAPKPIQAQIYTKGDILIDAYYGTPSTLRGVIDGANLFSMFDSKITTYPTKEFGIIGIRGEYLLTTRLGIGLDLTYYNYHNNMNTPVANENYDDLHTYKFLYNRITSSILVNYHFLQTKVLDVYGFGGGGVIRKINTYKYDDSTIPTTKNGYTRITYAIGIGTRYFITPQFGVHLNIAYGITSFIQAGITYRISKD